MMRMRYAASLWQHRNKCRYRKNDSTEIEGVVKMNLATWLIAGLVAAVFAAIVGRGIYNKKTGRSSCSCGCSCGGCSMSSMCHKTE